jgi:hypothetical protein
MKSSESGFAPTRSIVFCGDKSGRQDPKGLPMEEVRTIRETIRSRVQRLIEEEQVV